MAICKLTDWIEFFASEQKLYIHDLWSVYVLNYSDQECRLIFEHQSHQTPSKSNPARVWQYIISPLKHENSLLAIIVLLAEFQFSLLNIIENLSSIPLVENDMPLTGQLGTATVDVMIYLNEGENE